MLSESVLPFAQCLFPEMDSVLGAGVIAVHATFAFAVPLGAPVIESDVFHGAAFLANAAAVAVVVCCEGSVFYEEFEEQAIVHTMKLLAAMFMKMKED